MLCQAHASAQKAATPGSAAVGLGLVLAKDASLLAGRAAAGIISGVNSIAEDLNLKSSLVDTAAFLRTEFGIDLAQSTLDNADATYKMLSGGAGVTARGILMGAGGASTSAVVTGTAISPVRGSPHPQSSRITPASRSA